MSTFCIVCIGNFYYIFYNQYSAGTFLLSTINSVAGSSANISMKSVFVGTKDAIVKAIDDANFELPDVSDKDDSA